MKLTRFELTDFQEKPCQILSCCYNNSVLFIYIHGQKVFFSSSKNSGRVRLDQLTRYDFIVWSTFMGKATKENH